MINVPNWDERKEHYEDYWQLKNKRAVIHLCAPLEGGNYDYPPPPSSEDFWFNPQWGVGSARHGMENTYFGLDAYPNVALSIGPDLTEIHTPRERMHIASVQRVWRFVTELVRRSA